MSEEKIEHFRSLSRRIDELYSEGKDQEGAYLLKEAIEVAKGSDKAYHYFFQGEWAGYIEKDQNAQLDLFEKALQERPDDYFLLRNKGVSLSKKGLEDEAIEFFDKALAIKPNDKSTLLSFGYTLLQKEDIWGAYEKILKAREFDPKSKDVQNAFKYISKYLKEKAPEKADEKGVIVDETTDQGLPELSAVVKIVREGLKEKIDGFLAQMEETEEKRKEFLSNESLLKKNISKFFILRKWNSFTPIIPAKQGERYVGGGYFILHKGRGTVIDPGYNFIENFHQAGCRVVDIDNVVLSHAHDDHTSDFEPILTLVHQFNRKNNFKETDKGYKRLNLYVNTWSLIKFSGLLNLRGAGYIDRVFTMSPGQTYDVTQGMKLQVLNAYHDELITKKYSVGMKFLFEKDGSEKSIIFTSDTGLFPKKENKKTNIEVADTDKSEVWETYPEDDELNLLIAHIGSIKEKEFSASIDTQKNDIFYPNHLGIMGTCRMITALKPKLAVVSEFGEELGSFQKELIQIIDEAVKGFFSNTKIPPPKVLPGDLPFIYNIFDETMYCIIKEQMIPVADIAYGLPEPRGKKRFYYYENSQADALESLGEKATEFEKQRIKAQGLYFKNNRKTKGENKGVVS